MHKIDQKFLDAFIEVHEKEIAEANTKAEIQKSEREKARAERNPVAIESKNSLAGRKNGKIVYTDGTEEILEYDDGIREITKWQFGTNIAELILPTSVTHIGFGAFNSCKELTKIEIPDSVTCIGACSFSGCKKLSHVTIPESVTEIKGDAFSDCESLETVVILGDPKFGMHAFAYCANLKNIHMPCVSNIYIAVFHHCMALESLVLPSGLKKLGLSNFHNCPKLCLVTIPAAIEEIEDDCFWECPEFKTVNLSVADGVTKISKEDFCWCPAMAWKPPVPGITKMGRRSFPKIEKVGLIIPKSVTAINEGALEYIPNLKNIYYAGSKEDFAKIQVGKNNPKINGVFGKAKIHYNHK